MVSALALFYPTPLSKFHLRSAEPGMIIIQGNSILSVNAPIYAENLILANRIYTTEDLELKERIIAEISRYDWDINTAIAIAKCESGLNPKAFNPEINAKELGITNHGSYGVFQLNRTYDERLYDYRFNIAEAYKLYQKRFWQPWTCFSKKT